MNVTVEISGKQYTVSVGDQVKVARQQSDIGNSIIFDKVLFANDGKKDHFGTPVVKGAAVEASVLEQGRDPKVLIYKKKRRKGYQRKNGHRQDYTLLQIDKIKLSAAKKTAKKKQAEETAKED
ncbi:MAG TPA: 50S ribosomal protein L21 [Candidatus Marinimicrobia bacterium]|jgi:large subunit ribosomal protein L21|nr:50S ribosomal protein L21 [Candidatus Neomarinimicrobiota bacterium]MDP6275352.1 50S ribosomal protein L21 [Candidatus Neomarinimicrobiota bacterium]MDP7329668.1 50S ribosomal protein L21 [Candidatus Neomarinimicrobiota bacterium]MDP7436284.1 50S ribosomal protein L21 [Candidatus Neomarinimicrobiota bacterium]HJL75425.1 50S ribosomal protein L21 [Candidatus Neomarinimicrobiota bacterium]|tara:strand:+ start:1261 stop:1629 length:369 start_codon:yes stop_codon:yes gene_type:complete